MHHVVRLLGVLGQIGLPALAHGKLPNAVSVDDGVRPEDFVFGVHELLQEVGQGIGSAGPGAEKDQARARGPAQLVDFGCQVKVYMFWMFWFSGIYG